jgi:peptidoglycan hydrolase CwlO-like protein
MEKNKMLYLRRLSFIIILSIFGVITLFAENDGGGTDGAEPSEVNDSVSTYKSETTISETKENIKNIEKSLQEIAGAYRSLLEKTLKVPIWHIISVISQALIAVSILGAVVLLVLKKTIFSTIPGMPEAGFSAFPQKESPVVAEPKGVAPEVSAAEFDTLKDKLGAIESQLRQLTGKIDSQSKDASRFESDLTSFQKEMTDNKQKIRNTEASVSSLKTSLDKEIEKRARKEEVESDPVAVFNKWAQSPRLPLPLYFIYVAVLKLEFRTKQEFTDTHTETDWIRNTIGEKKYIFPNPSKIDSLSGPVDKLYKVVGTRKGLEANTVKIIDACQIKEGNFIEYQGELQLM